ncbi:MAG: hypothetical protein WDN00_15415 [Limisphaerales bacterium]
MSPKPYLQKLAGNVREIWKDGLLNSGATWAAMLFFAGLFMGFRNLGIKRIRYFLLMCLYLFMNVQCLGRTYLSDMSPDVNSENLLVLLVPLVFIFGSCFFFTLLDQMILPMTQLRYAVIAAFVWLCTAPLIATVVMKNTPVVYPPYYPPEIQQTAGWMKPDELMMSDVPWGGGMVWQPAMRLAHAGCTEGVLRHQRQSEDRSGIIPHAVDHGCQVRQRLGADARLQLGQFHCGLGCKK